VQALASRIAAPAPWWLSTGLLTGRGSAAAGDLFLIAKNHFQGRLLRQSDSIDVFSRTVCIAQPPLLMDF
jgi:hypothetical protein